MKHSIVFKNKNVYASFPLLQYEDGILTIGFFTAPTADHTGIFKWQIMMSFDEGQTWENLSDKFKSNPHNWPSVSSREISDRFTTTLPCGKEIATGSFGFKLSNDKPKRIIKSKHLFFRSSKNNWKTIKEKAWMVPNADVVVTFPRHFQNDNLILIPGYIVLEGESNINRGFVWRSDDYGEGFKLYNMFPFEVDANEMSFVQTKRGILCHIRSDKSPYIMESWSEDEGATWTYPMNICSNDHSVIGGPAHLLRTHNNDILCTYGYRHGDMGIRAIVSKDEGLSWSWPKILREDGGYASALWKKRKWWQKKISPANDIGYPVSIQLKDHSILTAYYITLEDKITHIATTKWEA